MRKIQEPAGAESLDKVRICGKGETMRRSGRKNLGSFQESESSGL